MSGDGGESPREGAIAAQPARQPRAPAMATSCVVCGFVERALERRIVFLLAEGIGEAWFVHAMRRGGFCLPHARRFVAAGEGPRLTSAIGDTLAGWLAAADPARAPTVGAACPLCDTETWAEGHALALVADGREDRIRLSLPAGHPLCLRHLDRQLGVVAWTRVEEVRADVEARVATLAALLADARAAVEVVAGGDPQAAVRRSPYRSAPDPMGASVPDRSHRWEDGILSADGLVGELAAGRCPVCSAAVAATRRFLLWLDAAEDGGADRRDLDALCGPHLFDALELAPRAVPPVLASSLGRWTSAMEVLAGLKVPPRRLRHRLVALAARDRGGTATGSSRRWDEALARRWAFLVSPAAVVADGVRRARLRRQRRCVACVATVTAVERTVELLDAHLAGEAARRSFQETGGLCLRHAAQASARLAPGAATAVLEVARARGYRLGWEVDEALRKSAWTTRYEPRGPETLAWRRGLAFLLGEPAVDLVGPLAPEPGEPRAAV